MLLTLELVAVGLGVAYVILAILENRFCWIFGALSSALYIILYLPQKLFVFAGLNIIYVVMALIGFLNWSKTKRSEPLLIRKMDLSQLLVHILVALMSAAAIFYLLNYFLISYSVSAFESVAGGSAVAAMLATVKKFLENWLFWIFSNLTYIALFLLLQHYPTALLYLGFSMLAAVGYYRWRKKYYNRVA